jgi:asparagine synthase (glutamine-hydrolysing)
MYQTAPYTGFKNVFKLLPGHYLTVDAGSAGSPRIERYWSISPRNEINDLAAATDALDSLLQDSIQRHMISDVPIGVLLSGGLDSSLLVALMSKHTTEPINSFTITFTRDDQKHERMADDSRYARDVAAMFHCNHREIEIRPDIVDLLPKMMWHLDEPLADPAAINTFLISRAAREHGIPVLLGGAGADEVFGGYRKYLACLIADQYQMVTPAPARRLLNTAVSWLPTATSGRGLRTIRWGKRFLSFAGLPQDERFLCSFSVPPHEFDQLFVKTPSNGVRFQDSYFALAQRDLVRWPDLSYLARMCLADTSVYLPDHNLLYGDKCSMAAGVEARPPFTDHRIVEFMFTTDDKLRIDGFRQKVLLKKVAERYLPHNIIYRPKAPFGAPLRAWIRGPLAEMIGDYLSPQALKRRGIYNTDFVWTKIANDAGGREDNAHLIWTLLCNEVWIRTFFDRSL